MSGRKCQCLSDLEKGQSDSDDDDDPFDNFTAGEVAAAQQLADNIQRPTTFELDRFTGDGEEEEDDYEDPGSPGR